MAKGRSSTSNTWCSVRSIIGVLLLFASGFVFYAFYSLHGLSTNQIDIHELELKLSDLEARQKKVHLLIQQAQELIDSSTKKGTVDSSKLESLKTMSSTIDHLIEEPTEPIVMNTPEPVITRQSKPKFPAPVTFSSAKSSAQAVPSVLVVGGTDGSGTRRVVQVLTQLGVTMVSEDPETYDIHGDLMGGWPPIVSPVIQSTKSLQYSITNGRIPAAVQKHVDTQLRRLITQARGDSFKPQSFILAKGGKLKTPPGLSAPLVEFGFKAPVAMTLAPWWLHVLPSFKFLHVVRDGRDIAFSANQGPVDKFYRTMYDGTSHMSLSPPLKGIKLWSDWNAQIFKWAQERAQDPAVQDFSYLLLHSEDLVSDSVAVKFAAISKLADWTGSTIGEDAMCCLAVLDSEFMGSHDRSTLAKAKGSSKKVTSRYGKWKQQIVGKGDLGGQLHQIGAEGLQLLGYEPMRQLADQDAARSTGYQCKLTVEQCGGIAEPPAPKLDPTQKRSVAENKCDVWSAVDFKGSDLLSAMTGVGKSPDQKTEECCKLCSATTGCSHFTLDLSSGWCYLKTGQGELAMGNGQLVSGSLANGGHA